MVAALLAPHDSGLVEHRQVLDVLLGGARGLAQLADGAAAIAEVVEQPNPHRLADDPEALGDQLDERVGERGEVPLDRP